LLHISKHQHDKLDRKGAIKVDKTEYVKETFTGGLNCAQAVFAAFSEDYGLDRETAVRIASALGGGVRCGEICGAVTGAALVIGLKNGYKSADDHAAKEQCANEIRQFTERFKTENGALVCRDILGVDISEDSGRRRALERNLFNTVCVDMVTSAVEIHEDMGY
jgi:C_GCAxxG_C_C family probable redox protein